MIKLTHNYTLFARVYRTVQLYQPSMYSSNLYIFNQTRKKYLSNNSNSLRDVKLSTFLSQVREIIVKNKDNTYNAQFNIETKWLDFIKNSIKDSDVYNNNKSILINAFKVLQLFKSNGNFPRNFKFINNHIVNIDYIFITFSFLTSYHSRNKATSLMSLIGKQICFNIFINVAEFREKYVNFDEFIKSEVGDDKKDVFFIKLGDIFITTFTIPINPVFERVFLDENAFVYRINPFFKSEIQKNIIIHPQALPMIHKPKIWGDNEWGGFILNGEQYYEESLIIGSAHHDHKISLDKLIYDTVNKLNSQTFSVNTDILDYLENDGRFILEYYSRKSSDININNLITLDIAKTFRDVPFYLNVNIDWRGRVYTRSFYLDYQASEFSLAFINLDKGHKLDEKGKFFFYVYGANLHNERGISKKNFNERYEWVLNNLDKIYKMDPQFILQAESPTLFATFCLVMQKLNKNPDLEVFTPIFLDATCSGVQHLSAMILDKEIAKYVNLIESDKVQDYYGELIPKINKAINESWTENPKNFKFKDIELNRSNLKKVIMTKNYNVTGYGICEQLKAEFEKVKKTINVSGKDIIVHDYVIPAKNKTGNVILDNIEVEGLADIVNDNIFNQFPSLYSIFKYFTKLAKILVKMEIPISWSTPNGLILTQKYNLSKVHKITINFLGKNRTAVLRKWGKEIDTRREVQAVIPNIIHSMDASHLISTINEWCLNKYILPIHDCFGTHPNDMTNLAEVIRDTFINLYSDNIFLEKIDRKFREDIKDYKIDIVTKNNIEFVKIKRKNRYEYLELPVLPKRGDLNISDIKKSKYMIS